MVKVKRMQRPGTEAIRTKSQLSALKTKTRMLRYDPALHRLPMYIYHVSFVTYSKYLPAAIQTTGLYIN